MLPALSPLFRHGYNPLGSVRRALVVSGIKMSEAVKLIVDARVSLKDRIALEEMRQHRQRLKNELLLKSGQSYDFSLTIKCFDDDLTAIEEGLARLDAH